MSFPLSPHIERSQKKEGKRGTRKVSSTSRLRFARRTTPRIRTTPMILGFQKSRLGSSSKSFTGVQSAFRRDFCPPDVSLACKIRARGILDGCARGTDAKGIEFDRLGDAECSRVGARARDRSRVRRRASMSKEMFRAPVHF